MLTPIEIQSKSFKSGGLGYDKREVDQFMREVLSGYEVLYRENMELRDKVTALTQGIQYYKTIEKTLQKALVLAEKTAEDTKAAAVKKAQNIESEALTKSQIILSDAQNELQHIRTQVFQLLQQYETYKIQFKSLAKAQMELLESETFTIHPSSIQENPLVSEFPTKKEKEELLPQEEKTDELTNSFEDTYEDSSVLEKEELPSQEETDGFEFIDIENDV